MLHRPAGRCDLRPLGCEPHDLVVSQVAVHHPSGVTKRRRPLASRVIIGVSDAAEPVDRGEVLLAELGIADAEAFLGGEAEHADLAWWAFLWTSSAAWPTSSRL